MLIKTIEEVRLYIPNHRLDDIQGLKGYIDSSERDFLADKLGMELYNAVCEKYNSMRPEELFPENADQWNEWHRLIRAAQPVVVFDALYRSADLNVISINEAGMNIASSDNYEAADDKMIEKFKSRCNTESHRAVDRMLVLLETWAQEVGTLPDDPTEDEEDMKHIVRLWKKSRYYYQDSSLFISTATQMQQYLDIYESREKFVTLLPQLRYIQSILVEGEIGSSFVHYLIKSQKEGKLTNQETILVEKICWWMAFAVESRSKMFNRSEAVEDAIKMRQNTIGFIEKNYADFSSNIGIDSPLYVAPVEESTSSVPKWENNRPGNKLFVTPSIDTKL